MFYADSASPCDAMGNAALCGGQGPPVAQNFNPEGVSVALKGLKNIQELSFLEDTIRKPKAQGFRNCILIGQVSEHVSEVSCG